ncbi:MULTISPECIES: SGNH/GDSL hydrolase family protein [unclassified Clostridioides]|uniref:SGNH/GDSL hydrolase family protein n=1 Tax=unclassified Clostridioides TaxID=2635829 RepID=UPI001D0C4618|nr:SGNH/GDSL hydrolase family protein [Clostridioides sp. ES-S-0001-02]MCC0640137.1 SGNH/GDSL hydrolase family protein [Clostridioides sp. ES-S-0049-03]MCC0655580.1 SGNH/GDSL hydrolase family protein [Clostridioides sp. ES-S-0123-01]MCC0673260.1 SGNH/GDSL hydrolase family protein [Clostridioides sp. ES-S-0145-01]MCC0674641.1 SGNH/GDSL hydrolase family protein [Clostridioides sp. ES-W-0018-02]MCC0679164.1 SGNH/GDSL hydrolase family protein [Clostridioides sp. ES-S-0005-03]MCC0702678.1 SGNH/GDS
MKIVCLGDSLTYGFGVSRSNSWTNIVSQETGLEIINKGINGDTTSGMLVRFNEDVLQNSPDMVFIMGGTNDFIAGAGNEVINSNIMAMVHQAYAKNIIPIIGIPLRPDIPNVREDWSSFTDFNTVSKKLESYNYWIKKFSVTFNTDFVDFYSEYNKSMEKEGYKKLYFDGLHPTKEGHRIIANIFIKSINKYIEES